MPGQCSDCFAVFLLPSPSPLLLPCIQPVLEATATVVFLNKNYSPVRIPSDIKSKLTLFLRDQQERVKAA